MHRRVNIPLKAHENCVYSEKGFLWQPLRAFQQYYMLLSLSHSAIAMVVDIVPVAQHVLMFFDQGGVTAFHLALIGSSVVRLRFLLARRVLSLDLVSPLPESHTHPDHAEIIIRPNVNIYLWMDFHRFQCFCEDEHSISVCHFRNNRNVGVSFHFALPNSVRICDSLHPFTCSQHLAIYASTMRGELQCRREK